MKLYNFIGALAGTALTLATIGCKLALHKSTLPPVTPSTEVVKYLNETTGEIVERRHYSKIDRDVIVAKNATGKKVDALEQLTQFVWESGVFDDDTIKFYEKALGQRFMLKSAQFDIGPETIVNTYNETVQINLGIQVDVGYPIGSSFEESPVMFQTYGFLSETPLDDQGALVMQIFWPYLTLVDYNADGLSALDEDKLFWLDSVTGDWHRGLLGKQDEKVVADLMKNYALYTVRAFHVTEKVLAEKEQ